jgi:hypothetical protein|tara:strand:- start:133 stop:318 length:186 start_codon:yes stop_codon:yes gene_type:complete
MRHRARVFSPTNEKFSNEHLPKGGVVPEIPSRGDGVRQFIIVLLIIVVVDDASFRRGREAI